jgi:hypothetical protein
MLSFRLQTRTENPSITVGLKCLLASRMLGVEKHA